MPMIEMTAISSVDITKLGFLAKTVRQRAKKRLKIWARIFKEEYDKTVASWDKRPIFTTKFESLPEGEQVTIATDNIIYRYLHDGTKVRWAVMSPDWSSKTMPRTLSSSPGRGRAVLRGKKQMFAAGVLQPMKGIDAREWTQAIIAKWEGPFQKDMDEKILKNIKASDWSHSGPIEI